jgi:hypothetical protein
MGFGYGGVWGMGYCGPIGYGMQFPANQVGRRLELWVIRIYIRGYGLSEVWVSDCNIALQICRSFNVITSDGNKHTKNPWWDTVV